MTFGRSRTCPLGDNCLYNQFSPIDEVAREIRLREIRLIVNPSQTKTHHLMCTPDVAARFSERPRIPIFHAMFLTIASRMPSADPEEVQVPWLLLIEPPFVGSVSVLKALYGSFVRDLTHKMSTTKDFWDLH